MISKSVLKINAQQGFEMLVISQVFQDSSTNLSYTLALK